MVNRFSCLESWRQNANLSFITRLRWPDLSMGPTIDNLITIETPVRLGDYRLKYDNVNVHNHTYNLDDFVQLNGGSNKIDALWPAWARKKFWRNKIINNIPKAGNGGSGEWGVAGRTFPGANNIQVLSSSHFGRISEIDQHSIMMQRVEEWITQVEPQLIRDK